MSAVLLAFTRKARGKDPLPLVLDGGGDPGAPCPACGGRSFHAAPDRSWACGTCSPPVMPEDASNMDGWRFCCLPEDLP